MGDHILSGNPPIVVRLRHVARARRMTLRVSALDGAVTLTVPPRISDREALQFAEEKADWLRANLAQQSPVVRIALGASLPVEGQMCRVIAGAGRRVIRRGTELHVPGPSDQVARRLLGFLKTLARSRLAEASDFYAERLGRSYSRITIRDTRSRWGSCSSRGALNYSWRLVLAPPDVLRYVAAHEVAHLAEMNHSAAFWRNVETLYGPYEVQRRWLRSEGAALHRFQFTAE